VWIKFSKKKFTTEESKVISCWREGRGMQKRYKIETGERQEERQWGDRKEISAQRRRERLEKLTSQLK
jgi:hypothetical protein